MTIEKRPKMEDCSTWTIFPPRSVTAWLISATRPVRSLPSAVSAMMRSLNGSEARPRLIIHAHEEVVVRDAAAGKARGRGTRRGLRRGPERVVARGRDLGPQRPRDVVRVPAEADGRALDDLVVGAREREVDGCGGRRAG